MSSVHDLIIYLIRFLHNTFIMNSIHIKATPFSDIAIKKTICHYNMLFFFGADKKEIASWYKYVPIHISG